MSEGPLGTYDLLNRQTKSFEQVQLWSPISQNDLADFESHWRPLFDAGLRRLRKSGNLTLGTLGENELQDAYWKWADKVEERGNRLEWRSFSVRSARHTEGLMFTRLGPFGRAESHKNLPIVMIDLVATAPWNRIKLVPEPKLKGVGRLMLATAISLSVSEEFNGRIGLHALPQAETWYRDVCGMTDLGVDSSKMHYFEMTEAQASAFINNAQ
jgi:hypothetical protein